MRAVIQRVSQASVSGGGKVASIQQGFCILLGIAADDSEEDLDYITQKTLHIKAFSGESEEDRWKRSIVDIQGEILLVSQFTLHAVFKGQGRVSFHRAMPPDRSRELFQLAIDKFQERYSQDAVKACVFGSYMNVSLVNDGPVTFIIDSKSPKWMGKRNRKTKSSSNNKLPVEETTEENWTYDPSAYDFFFQLDSEWPCLTFDFLPGESNSQLIPPYSLGFLSGTQADKPHKNQILLAKISNIYKRKPRTESDSDDSSEEDEQEPQFHSYVSKHQGTVNRIRAAPQIETSLGALWSDTGVFEFIRYGSLSSLESNSSSSSRETTLIEPLQNFEDPMGEGFSVMWSSLLTGHLVCGNCGGHIRRWQPSNETCSSFVVDAHPFEGHQASVEDLQWSPVEPTVFVSSSVDQSIRFWDTRLGKRCALAMERAHPSDINVLSWNPIDTHLLVSGGDEGMFQVWDLRTLTTEQSKQNPTSPVAKFDFHKSPIVAIEWSPFESSSLVCASADGRISFWDLSLEADQEEESEQTMPSDEKWKDIPPQLLFLHEGQKDPKDVHWHPQIPSLIMSTGSNGFHIFKPENI